MREYYPTIGLEIHAELKTKTKMFCDSKNDPDEKKPNVNICPVCMSHPGTLPVINKEAVRHVLRVGTAIGGKIADYTEFDRKNYFYPDIPKGYQISQYKHPLVLGGEILGVKITRIHLEEDTARSTHDKGDTSLIDFNRAGVPLMELVTEPVINDATTASRFAKELQLLLWSLNASEANMEKGEMRVEANISISSDKNKFGTKVEVKNLNSFKAVEKAIEYELVRQKEILERGESVTQETRGWDEKREETFSQRVKEESHDYRYFPDPDLAKLKISEIAEFNTDDLERSLPELPWVKRNRYSKEWGITEEASEIYTRDFVKGQYIDKVEKILSDKKLIKLASNYVTSVTDVTNVEPEAFSQVVLMVNNNELSATGSKELLKRLQTEKVDVRELANTLGLIQKNNIEDLEKIINKVVEENQNAVLEYKSGKLSSIQYLIGQAMKESKGSGNPKIFREILERVLS